MQAGARRAACAADSSCLPYAGPQSYSSLSTIVQLGCSISGWAGAGTDLEALKDAPLGELVTLPGLLCGEACQLGLVPACRPRSTTGGLGACSAAEATGWRDLWGVVPGEWQQAGCGQALRQLVGNACIVCAGTSLESNRQVPCASAVLCLCQIVSDAGCTHLAGGWGSCLLLPPCCLPAGMP